MAQEERFYDIKQLWSVFFLYINLENMRGARWRSDQGK